MAETNTDLDSRWTTEAAARIALAGYPWPTIFPAGDNNCTHGWQEESDAATTKVYA